MDIYDMEGLNDEKLTMPRMEILGYADRSQVPRVYQIGPSYVLSGDKSQKACTAIAGLARALDRLGKVAICKCFKTKSPEFIVGSLLPLVEPEFTDPVRLVFTQLPFAGDVKRLNLPSFEEVWETSTDNSEKERACDDLIDSFMLSETALQSGKIPSPFLRSWNQTKVKRAIDPDAPLVFARESSDGDPMITPSELFSNGRAALSKFDASFPLKVEKTVKPKKGEGRKGKTVLTYKDFLKE